MKTFGQSTLTISLATALLVGCGVLRQAQDDMQPPISAPGVMPQSRAIAARTNNKSYRVLHSFGKAPDGNNPRASLIDVNGTFYGTTSGGGSHSCGSGSRSLEGCGTVFTITPSGTENVLYSFGAPPDGAIPRASLIDVDGTLYGTTSEGGSNTCGYGNNYYPYVSCGTVFSITPGGTETVLHSFGARADGVKPNAPLINVNGTLYGTTALGGGVAVCEPAGRFRCGTVFSITTGGSENVVYSFGQRDHPHWPQAGLVDVGGRFYGTTERGGQYEHSGTVFTITRSGRVKVLHSFNFNNGFDPFASLIEVSGTLYGTTLEGGAHGAGTVFSITTIGTEKVVHSFGYGSDGANPVASLIDANGTLYGTTTKGGVYGAGTVFSITTSGTEKVLHNFGHGNDGSAPVASLIDVNGTLYGTTESGGAHGKGTVFALSP